MKRIVSFIIVLLLSFLFLNLNVKASSDLDYIDDYYITVEPRMDDGTLDIRIDINWTVLDSNSEGPLEWVKIGIPNYHVHNIKALTNNIDDIRYYSDSGSYIRLDFKQAYYKGEKLSFSFSFNQERMYHLDGDYVYYDYNPGYFSDILVGNCVLKWKYSPDVELSDENKKGELIDSYYVWSAKLSYNETIKVNLRYNKDSFTTTLSPKKQYTDSYTTPFEKFMVVVGVLSMIGFIVFIILYTRLHTNPYLYERGFRMYRFPFFFHFHYYHSGLKSNGEKISMPKTVVGSSGGGHYSGGSCACACACACAGGGRAGCSMKDFYHTNLKSEKVIDVLQGELKN